MVLQNTQRPRKKKKTTMSGLKYKNGELITDKDTVIKRLKQMDGNITEQKQLTEDELKYIEKAAMKMACLFLPK
mgnify:CR=1 FL=1